MVVAPAVCRGLSVRRGVVVAAAAALSVALCGCLRPWVVSCLPVVVAWLCGASVGLLVAVTFVSVWLSACVTSVSVAVVVTCVSVASSACLLWVVVLSLSASVVALSVPVCGSVSVAVAVCPSVIVSGLPVPFSGCVASSVGVSLSDTAAGVVGASRLLK